MKKLLLAVIVIIFLFSLTCGKRGRGKSKTSYGGNTYNRNTNYGGKVFCLTLVIFKINQYLFLGNSYNRNTNYGSSNKYGFCL